MRSFSLSLAALAVAACTAPAPGVGQPCGAAGLCASGLACGPDQRCLPQAELGRPADMGAGADLTAAIDLAMCTKGGCAAPTPVCDQSTGQCVGCLLDLDCPDGTLCHYTQCVPGCTRYRGCGDGGACNLDAGVCQTCKSDLDCPDPQNPRCDGQSGRCGPCLPFKDNCGPNQFCKPAQSGWKCAVGCKADPDCAAPATDGGAPDGGAPAPAVCCDHVCTDLAFDVANCGKCGNACMNGNACCAGACIDVTADPANCGHCGQRCAGKNANWTCAKSACAITSCAGTFRDCNVDPSDGCESDILADPKNCLGCGMACVTPHATPSCAQACGVAGCDPGYADCNKTPNDGCEVYTGGDVANCGACGKACGPPDNGVAACKSGQCAIGSCNAGYADCDGDPANGCEVSLNGDPRNCGACAMICPAPKNAAPGCVAGVCGLGACTAPFKHCSMDPKVGCEVNAATDANNCGQCGAQCPPVANGTGGCAAGLCGVGVCDAGFADCDKKGANGCEVNLNTDPLNCTGCGKRCPAVAHGQPGCFNGICGVGSCAAGFGDCNFDPGDGCETNLMTDATNCSACGMACPNGQICGNGVCLSRPECAGAKPLDDASRNVNNGGAYACDSGLTAQWYRFVGGTGTQMPTSAPPVNSCGTQAPGWLNGTYPMIGEGIVTRQVCYSWKGNPCNWVNNIQVSNCGAYYVFLLFPSPSCNLRYCGSN